MPHSPGNVVVCPSGLAEAEAGLGEAPRLWEENLLQNMAPRAGPEPLQAGSRPSVFLPDSWACKHLPQMDGRALETCQVFIIDGKCYSWTLVSAEAICPWPPQGTCGCSLDPHTQSKEPF